MKIKCISIFSICVLAATLCLFADSSSKVLELNDATFNQAIASHDLMVVDFYAKWCGPCKKLAPIYAAVAEELSSSVTFAKVDIDTARKLGEQQHVSSYPTLILYRKGVEVKRRTGGCKASVLKDWILEYAQKK